MSHRLECSICGKKSLAVDDPRLVTATELRSLSEFREEHFSSCAGADSIVYPNGPCTAEVPAEVVAAAQTGPFGSAKRPPKAVRKPHGHTERIGPYGEQEEGDTLSCCHCRKHWEVRIGSGRERGFCTLCMGVTCGAPACDACIPFNLRLDNVAAGLPKLTPRPAQAVVPAFGAAVDLSYAISEKTNGPSEETGGNFGAKSSCGEDAGVGLASCGRGREGDGGPQGGSLV